MTERERIEKRIKEILRTDVIISCMPRWKGWDDAIVKKIVAVMYQSDTLEALTGKPRDTSW